MQYADLIAAMRRYGAAPEAACRRTLGVEATRVRAGVIVTPGWPPERFGALGRAELMGRGLNSVRAYDLPDCGLTYVMAGYGAPVVLDAVLALGLTGCQRVLFVSSVGALDPDMAIGDLVVTHSTVCGDGASRYIASADLAFDAFGERMAPDAALLDRLDAIAARHCRACGVRLHVGRTFCTDTLFAQYAHIDAIRARGCNGLDMELAAALRAAKLCGLPIAAMSCVSDNTAAGRSLLNAHTEADERRRAYVRGEVMPGIVRELFEDMVNAG